MPTATLDKVADLPTIDVPDVELCSTGTWNGRPYTREEFDEAVKNARELGDKYAIPLKLGHNDEQQLAQADGDPAIGWVTNVRREGNSLFGDYKKVPLKLAQLIKSGAYRTRSCEFLINQEVAGKVRKFMLGAVALLGADLPAVDSLADIHKLYNSAELQASMRLAKDAKNRVHIDLAAEKPYKTEGGQKFHAEDYAHTPDKSDPSTWSVRLAPSPGAKPTPQQVGAAVAAIGKGFRGKKAKIAPANKAKVKAKVRSAWKAANPDKGSDDMPDVLKNMRLDALRSVNEETAAAYLSLINARLLLVSGPPADDIQSAVMKALQATYPPAKGDDDDDTPGQDGPSQNVVDWYISGSQMSVIVSDQDVDNLWEIPVTYDQASDTATLGTPQPVRGTYQPNETGQESGGGTPGPTDDTTDSGTDTGGDTSTLAAEPMTGAHNHPDGTHAHADGAPEDGDHNHQPGSDGSHTHADGTTHGAHQHDPEATADDGDHEHLPATAQMGRVLDESLTTLQELLALQPNEPVLKKLNAELTGQPMLITLAAAAGTGDPQKAIQKIVAALDQALSDMGQTASGRPGMGFIRTTLTEVKKKLGSMKFPKPAAGKPVGANKPVAPAKAMNARSGDVDVKQSELALKLGLPANATEAQINAALEQRAAPTAAIEALTRKLQKIEDRDTNQAIEDLIGGAIRDRRIRHSDDADSLEQTMRKLARTNFAEAQKIVAGLPKFIDEREYGSDAPGDTQEQMDERQRLARKYGDNPDRFKERKSLSQQWKEQIEKKERERLTRSGVPVVSR